MKSKTGTLAKREFTSKLTMTKRSFESETLFSLTICVKFSMFVDFSRYIPSGCQRDILLSCKLEILLRRARFKIDYTASRFELKTLYYSFKDR